MVKRESFVSIVLVLLVLLGLHLTTLHSYLLFHGIVEMFSIVVACGIFMLAWNARRFLDNTYLLFLGIAYLFVGGLDLIHTLAYTGMGVFEGYGTNLPTQLWIGARYVESLSLLIALLVLGRRLKVNVVFLGYALVTFLLLASIFYWNLFPVCFIEGIGLTPFKKISEYAISLILVASIAALLRKRREVDVSILRLLIASIVLTIVSELAFTLYIHAYGLPNMIGHYLKIVSFYLIYKAIIETGLARPYALLFRNLKQNEEALRKERDFTSAVLSTAGALVNVLDREGRIVGFNRACEQLTGYSFEEVKGRRLMDLFLIPEEVESVKAVFAELESGRFPQENENYWVAKDGSRRLVMWSNTVLLGRDGSVEHVIATGIDITERKRAEAEIIRTKEEWERTFNAVPDLIMILDNEYRVVRVNKAMADRLGCAPKDLVGRICYDAFHGAEEPTDQCPHARLMADGLAHSSEVHEDRLGGDFLVSVNPLHDPEGKLTGSVHVARDVTARKQAEEALQKAHTELERRVVERTAELAKANKLLKQEIKERERAEAALRRSENELRNLSSQLLSAQEDERKSVAQDLHDSIGQTLAAIKFGTESALGQLPKNASKAIRRPLEATISMVQSAIHEVRRIQTDLRPPTLDDLGILATISWFCREFQTIYSGIRIDKHIDIQEDDVADPLKTIIYRVMQEALSNVAKHSKADLVRLSLLKKSGRIELAIRDNGQCFDLEDRLLADGFRRGIGISSMKERIEVSGGSFAIESVEGIGTTVRASWPERP